MENSSYWTRTGTSHRPRRTPVSPPASRGPRRGCRAGQPVTGRPNRTFNVLTSRTPFTAVSSHRAAARPGGRRGAPCGKNTRTTAQHRAGYMRPAGDWRPLQDACIGKAQPDADPRAAATKTTPMMKTCTSRAHLTSEELTAKHRIALKASAAERRGLTRRRLLGSLLCR